MTATGLVEIEDARRIVLAHTRALRAERVALAKSLGRVLAQDVAASEPVPAFDSSAMDGFAVRARDLDGARRERPVALRVVDESRAGAPASRALGPGEAIAISTGAALPAGADAVVRIEQARREGACVQVLAGAPAGRDIRRAGEDMQPGETILRSGATLGAAELGVLAALGQAHVMCTCRPQLAVLVSGDELLAPDEPMRPGGVRDSSSFTIPALAACSGAQVARVVRVRDDRQATTAAIGAAVAEADALVICGGVSVGAHDHVRASLRELGVRERFWGVALKPGRPTWFGTAGQTPVFGLPGNPVSAMVTFVLLVRPALRALLGARQAEDQVTAVMARDYAKPAGRAHAVRCRLRAAQDGWRAEPTGAQGSHILTSMLAADALAIVPSDSAGIRAGERVAIEPLSSWAGAHA